MSGSWSLKDVAYGLLIFAAGCLGNWMFDKVMDKAMELLDRWRGVKRQVVVDYIPVNYPFPAVPESIVHPLPPPSANKKRSRSAVKPKVKNARKSRSRSRRNSGNRNGNNSASNSSRLASLKYEQEKYVATEWVPPKPKAVVNSSSQADGPTPDVAHGRSSAVKERVVDPALKEAKARPRSSATLPGPVLPLKSTEGSNSRGTSSSAAASAPAVVVKAEAQQPKAAEVDLLGLDAPTPVKDATANDLFSDFLSSSDSQQLPSDYNTQFGAVPQAAVTSGAQDVGLLEATEQKKATKDAIMVLYGTSSVGNMYMANQQVGMMAPNGMVTMVPAMGMAPGMQDQIRYKLIRRYKYLEKSFEDELKKLILFLKGFSEPERAKLAKVVGICLANGLGSPTCLVPLFEDHLVKEGLSLDFAQCMFKAWLQEKDMQNVATALKKSGIEGKLLELLPINKRTQENFENLFLAAGLEQIVEYQRVKANAERKKGIQSKLEDMIHNDEPVKEMISLVKDHMAKTNMQEHEMVVMGWNTLMNAVEWNKKEELVADQALKHLKQYTSLLAALTENGRSELALITKMQEYCYDNMNFLKVFQKIVVLFYKADVLGEDSIIKWYQDSHLPKGKSVLLEQMKSFIQWLQNAEEESEEED